VNYSISSACATSAHCIGNAAEMIQWGKQDVMFAGGGEELDWTCRAVRRHGRHVLQVQRPARHGVRAYDKNRDGFVIAGGAGVVVLEELEHAKARGAKIYAELVGYGATSDGYDMVAPSGEGAVRCMRLAMSTVKGRDRLHQPARHLDAGGRRQGDRGHPRSLRREDPAHLLDQVADRPFAGRAGVQEAIYSLLMMKNGFLCESANIEELDPAFEGVPILRKRVDNAKVDTVMSNSFGFGGTNATLVFQRYNG
jgi:3-oxoacyl-[acyl-carrier-protein] synthase-1